MISHGQISHKTLHIFQNWHCCLLSNEFVYKKIELANKKKFMVIEHVFLFLFETHTPLLR